MDVFIGTAVEGFIVTDGIAPYWFVLMLLISAQKRLTNFCSIYAMHKERRHGSNAGLLER